MSDALSSLVLARLEEQGIRLDTLERQLGFSDRMLDILMRSVIDLTVRVQLLERGAEQGGRP